MQFKVLLFSSLFACFSIFNAYSLYSVELNWSATERIGNQTPDMKILGMNGHGIYILHYDQSNLNREARVHRYSESMRLQQSNGFLANRSQMLQQAFVTGKEILLFYTEINRETDALDLKAIRLNPSLNGHSEPVTLASAEGVRQTQRFYDVMLSPNRRDILVFYSPKENESGDIAFAYFDQSLNPGRKGNMKLETDHKFNIRQVLFDANNITFLIAEELEGRSQPVSQRFAICHFSLDHALMTRLPLYDDKKYVKEGRLRLDRLNRSIQFTGVYQTAEDRTKEGFYILNYHLDGSDSLNVVFQPVPSSGFFIKDGGTVPRNSLDNFKVRESVARSDGGALIVLEFYDASRRMFQDVTSYGVSQNYVRYYFSYQDIIAVSLNKDGSIDWYQVVKKEQASINDEGLYSSHGFMVQPHQINVVFNDISRRHWNLMGFSVKQNGEMSRDVLVNGMAFDGRLIPRKAVQVSANQMVIPGFISRREMIFLLLSY
jgi:hypothetical protein